MAGEKEKGLNSHTIAFMIGVALFFDFLQFLLTFLMMGWLVGLFAGLTFWWWFRQHGVNFKKGSVWGSFAFAFILEVFPGVGAIPAWTLEVSYLALSHKAVEMVVNSGKKAPEKTPSAEEMQKVYSFQKGRGEISTEAAEEAA